MSDNQYGFCPTCRQPGKTRERRMGGNDTCKLGHVYPSDKALVEQVTSSVKPTSMLDFCPGCFASSEDGSWNYIVMGNRCMNCGAGGTIGIPKWAVESIRRQASWVGKRYYPHSEDTEINDEIELLRDTIKVMPGRRAEPASQAGHFNVIQERKDSSMMVTVMASSAKEALSKVHNQLPYTPRK